MVTQTLPFVPTSSFGWLDHREEDADRMRQVLAAFDDKGTLDSLGIGQIRDAFADMLFPGTSTIQTRARYFLFVPWVYQGLEQDRVPAARAHDEARKREVRLIHALIRGAGEDRQGIIGVNARERIKVLPREIYWTGLSTLHILTFRGSSAQYLASLDRHYRALRALDVESGDVPPGNWHTLPPPPEGLFDEVGFAMTPEEASYLRERMLTATEGSLLAELCRRPDEIHEVESAWALPFHAELSSTLRERIEHGRRFSLVIHGAQILYNLMLAEAAEVDRAEHGELVGELQGRGEKWADEIVQGRHDLGLWDLERFWTLVRRQNPRVPVRTQRFVEDWIERTLTDPSATLDDAGARRQIIDRELALKGGLARLSNRRAREVTQGPVGLERLNYRWPNVRLVLTDLKRGLAPG